MAEVLLQSVICFFVIYGIIQMGFSLYNTLSAAKLNKEDDVYIIITVKNQQDTIEGIIRSVVWKSLNNAHGGTLPKILVVDMGSTDETPQILSRLCLEYDFIQVTDSDEYVKTLEKLIH